MMRCEKDCSQHKHLLAWNIQLNLNSVSIKARGMRAIAQLKRDQDVMRAW